MADKYYRSTYVNVDLKAILSNYQAIGRLHPNKTIMPVVKANGYGLGSIEIANFLADHGVNFLAVATLDEAIELRMHGVKANLLILGVVPPDAIDKAIQHRVALTVPSQTWLEAALANIDEKNEKRLWLHVKIDTGMGRLGIKDAETYKTIIEMMEGHPHVIFEGVYTHFACADEPGDMTERQFEIFKTLVNSQAHPPYIHAQNSAGALLKDMSFCNAVRLGVSLYGYYPSDYVRENVKVHLKPAAQWVTEVIQTKTLQRGETVSYGATYTADEEMKVATLPVGYADGYKRLMQGGYVNANGHQCEVIGRVCMDQIMIRVPDDVNVGDKVILLDHHQGNPQSAEALAEQQQTINYEVLCNLSRRLPKIYFNEEEIDITNDLLK